MTEFGGTYRAREKGLFDPKSSEPFRLSRSKIEFFLECPRCFYLEQRLGVPRPDTIPFTLNNAVDELLKKEFDLHRVKKSAHPLMKAYNVDAVPFDHPKLSTWRDAKYHGVQHLHTPTHLMVRGGIDDVWYSAKKELIVVDYKATSKRSEIVLYESYKRQAEVYQWLFRQNGFKVSDTAYFVYVNGRTDREAFDGKLEFNVELITYKGDDSWIEHVLRDIKRILMSEIIPEKGRRCDFCPYRELAGKTLMNVVPKEQKQKTSTIRKIAKKEYVQKTTGQLF